MPRPEWSDTYERTEHPCAEDFRRFGRLAGLNDKQTDKVLALFAEPKDEVAQLTKQLLSGQAGCNAVTCKATKSA